MMTKKDYEVFAGMISTARRWATTEEALRVVCNLEEDMVDYFSKDNPNFDEARFLTAARNNDGV